jgi:Flp pilus assembly protein TadG
LGVKGAGLVCARWAFSRAFEGTWGRGVAAMVALIAISLFGLAVAAVDYSDSARQRTLFQAAADKAVIAGAHAAAGHGTWHRRYDVRHP